MAQALSYFAVHVGGPRDLKVDDLADALEIESLMAAGLVVRLWEEAARRGHDDGSLGRQQAERLARRLGWRHDAEALVRAFLEVGLLEETREGAFRVHDWAEHQPVIRERIRKRDCEVCGKKHVPACCPGCGKQHLPPYHDKPPGQEAPGGSGSRPEPDGDSCKGRKGGRKAGSPADRLRRAADAGLQDRTVRTLRRPPPTSDDEDRAA